MSEAADGPRPAIDACPHAGDQIGALSFALLVDEFTDHFGAMRVSRVEHGECVAGGIDGMRAEFLVDVGYHRKVEPAIRAQRG